MKISKKWGKHLELSSFYTGVPKIMIRWCAVPEKWCATDGWMEKGTEVGAPPNNYICHTPYPRNSIAYDHDFWFTCVKWYLWVFFSFFCNFDFLGFYRVSGQKIVQNDKKFCLLLLDISGTIHHMIVIYGTHA